MTSFEGIPVAPANLQPSHEPISDEMLGDFLAAAGNHEAKALVLLGMKPGVGYGVTGLHNLFIKPQGTELAYKGSTTNQMDYCKYSFEPIGAVARARFGDSLKFEITEKGETFGKAMAGHMLALSLDFPDLSLSDIWGMTKSTSEDGKRSPIKRLHVMEQLLIGANPTTIKRIGRAAGHPYKTLAHHVMQMGALGFAEVETSTTAEVKIGYAAPDVIAEYTPLYEQPTLSRAVVDAVNETSLNTDLGIVTLDEVEEKIRERERYKDQTGLRNNIGHVLTVLRDQGLLIPGKFTGSKLSHVTISDAQRTFLDRVVTLAHHLRRADPAFLEDGRELGELIRDDPESCRILIGKAMANSPEANKIDQETRFANIRAFVLQAGSVTAGEIVEAMGERGMTRSSTETTLQAMRKRGLMEAIKVGKCNLWDVIIEPVELSHT